MRKTSTWSKCANAGLPFVIIKYLFLCIVCKTLLFKCQKHTKQALGQNVQMWGCHLWFIKYLFLCMLCKTLLFKCQKCANVGLPFVIIKYLVLRGLHIFYVLLSPILVLDWFKKRLIKTGPLIFLRFLGPDWSQSFSN